MQRYRQFKLNSQQKHASSFSYTSTGGQSPLRGKESRCPGQGEDACGGRAGVHDQEVPRCLWAAGQYQPRAAEEREVWRQGCIDFTICLSTYWESGVKNYISAHADMMRDNTSYYQFDNGQMLGTHRQCIDFIACIVSLNSIICVILFNFVMFHPDKTRIGY